MTSSPTQKRFDASNYPDIKPSMPRHRTLRVCDSCKKPGYMYLQKVKTPNGIATSVYFIHYNEPPISLIKRTGQPLRFEYRRCTKNGITYNTLEEALADTIHEAKRAPRSNNSGRSLIIDPRHE